MKKTQFLVFIIAWFIVKNNFAQVQDNGIGGYGYIEYNLMHHQKFQGNWMYGGGGLIINKVYFMGLYYGSQTTSFTNYNTISGIRPLAVSYKDSSMITITPSDIGFQFGGVIFAEKPLQIILNLKNGFFLSNINEYKNLTTNISTRPYFTASPEFKIAFMPTKIFKMQAGVGYKFVNYVDSRILKNSEFGNRNTLFNSFYWSFSLVFGSF